MMPTGMVKSICHINAAGGLLLKTAIQSLNLNARSYNKILKAFSYP
jgi:magnesium chelatase family protein